MHTNSQDEYGEDDEEEEGVDGNRLAIGLEIAKLDAFVVTRKLEENPRWEQYEEQ